VDVPLLAISKGDSLRTSKPQLHMFRGRSRAPARAAPATLAWPTAIVLWLAIVSAGPPGIAGEAPSPPPAPSDAGARIDEWIARMDGADPAGVAEAAAGLIDI
jgi:hypothetical protein